MNINTMLIFLVLAMIVYSVLTYRQLRLQHKRLHDLAQQIEDQYNKSKNTDYLRREYNKTARAYNHKIDTFLGRRIAKRLKYVEMVILEKNN